MSLSEERNLPDASRAVAAAADNAVEAPTELLALLETSLDRVLRALGLKMGTIWLRPHRVTRGLAQEVAEIGKVAAYTGLSIPTCRPFPTGKKSEKQIPNWHLWQA